MTRHASGEWPVVEASNLTPPTFADLAESLEISLESVRNSKALLRTISPSPHTGTMAPVDATDMDSALLEASRQLRHAWRICTLYGVVDTTGSE